MLNANTPPTEQEMATMGKLVEQGFKEGWLLATEGCLPSKLGARVRRSGSNINVTDGPFTESKEVVGGFAILKAKLQGRSDTDGEGLPEGRRRGRVRASPDLRTRLALNCRLHEVIQ